jgi:hypothetical protein
MRNGQTKQVFIYMGALFVIATLLTIGFRSTSNVLSQSCDTAKQSFQGTLFNVLDQNRGPGNVQQADIATACDYTRLCAGTQATSSTPGLVNDTLQAGTGENIFLLSNGELQDTYQYDDLADTQITCTGASSGQFPLTIRGEPRGKVRIT